MMLIQWKDRSPYKLINPTSLLIFIFILSTFAKTIKDESLISILLWLPNTRISPSWNSEIWQSYFYNKQCRFKNCFLTHDYDYFEDIRNFDVIVYNIWTLSNYLKPSLRSENQTYIFFSEEPPNYCPMPFNKTAYTGFFNLTWTYKLDSDLTYKFIVIKDKRGEVIGPKTKMDWIEFEYMKPTGEHIRSKLRGKRKAAAWFVSHCDTSSKREVFVSKLNDELGKYGLTVDVYGTCGNLKCPKYSEECHALVEEDYYFYLAFENSMCEDYVTEKVLTAVKHFAVPIVYGGADYSRFLPPGSYLDAYTLGPVDLASSINDTITDKEKYYDFFRWHGYYSLHSPNETADTDEVCAFCEFLNNKHRINERFSYDESIFDFWSCHFNE